MYTIDDAIAELKAARLELPITQPLPDDAIIRDYEARLGFKFHADFIKLVKETGYSLCGAKDIVMLNPQINEWPDLSIVFQDAVAMGMPKNWLPFCEDNADFYCLLPNGTVRFHSHDGPSDEKWDNLAIWVRDVWVGGN